MNRITQQDLEATVASINRVTGSPEASYTQHGAEYRANIGNYHLSYAYGGVSLHRMGNVGGGTSDVFRCGHVTKRDLYERMHAFLGGLEAAQVCQAAAA